MKKSIQLDIKGPVDDIDGFTEGFLYFKGSAYQFFIPTPNYEELIKNGLFIRNGKTKDGANVINTTAVYKTSQP